MITEKRLVLLSTTRMINFLSKFEGIKVIEKESDVHTAWDFNKTPVCSSIIIGDYETVEVPDFDTSVIEIFSANFTKWAYSQGFEPGEYCKGRIFDTRKEPCVLCSIINHKGMTSSTEIYNAHVSNEVDCVIYESDNFIVVPELGALKPGFLMIVPKSHQFLSIAQLTDNLFKEYYEVCKDVETILKCTFGSQLPVTFFEHGSSPDGLSSHKKSIVHAHTHVVIDFVLKPKYLKMVRLQPIQHITEAKSSHYFSYQVGSEGELLCCYDKRVFVQRQFPRQVLALELGYTPTQYNWRSFQFLENVHTTLYRIHRILDSFDFNERISKRTKDFKIGYGMREIF